MAVKPILPSKPALPKLPAVAVPKPKEIVRSPKAQQLLDRLERLAPELPGIDGSLLDQLRELLGIDADEQLDALRARLRACIGSRMVAFGSGIADKLNTAGLARRLATEILMPASQRRLDAGAVWGRINGLLSDNRGAAMRSTHAPGGHSPGAIDLLREIAKDFPGWTLGIGLGPTAGAMGIGVSQTLGFAGMLRRQTVFFNSRAASLGEVDNGFALEISFFPCPPTQIAGTSIGIQVGYARGLSVTVGASIKPRDFARWLLSPKDMPLKDMRPEDLDSVTIGITVDSGIQLSASVQYVVTPFVLKGSSEDRPQEPARGPSPVPQPRPEGINAPSNLAASLQCPFGETITTLTWTDTNAPRTLTSHGWGYHVERATAGSACFSRIRTIYGNCTSYQDRVFAGFAYEYRVQAFYGGDVSAYSAVSRPLFAPVDLAVEIVAGGARLKWSHASASRTAPVGGGGYYVERARSGSMQFLRIGTVFGPGTVYEDRVREASRYRVQAFRAGNEVSGYSNIADTGPLA